VNRAGTRVNVLIAGAAILSLLVVPIALAGAQGDPASPNASASGSASKQLKKLKRRVAQLQAQASALTRPPGPQGPQGSQGSQGIQGAAGTAPVCAGNDAGDVMVDAGSVCIDRFEASVWSSPTGGSQYGVSSDNYPCNDNGQGCTNIYARSVAGVTPSRFITWFQAQQALANSGKRLPTNADWQQAVAGTPDPGSSPGSEDCNVQSGAPVATGSRANCISNHSASDMVGNVQEWVADWDEELLDCIVWPDAGFQDNNTCVGRASGEASTRFPGALSRGGQHLAGGLAGPFAIEPHRPSSTFSLIGFRGAR
jgi:Sulfatase-modifying factor enzyme 1